MSRRTIRENSQSPGSQRRPAGNVGGDAWSRRSSETPTFVVLRDHASVWGMGCPNCANRVRNSLLGLEGVVSAAIDLERGLAFVDYVPPRANLHDLILAVAADASSRRNIKKGTITVLRDDTSQAMTGGTITAQSLFHK